MKPTLNLLLILALVCGLMLWTGCPLIPDDPDYWDGNDPDDDPDDGDDEPDPNEPLWAGVVWAEKAGGPSADAAQAVTGLPDGSCIVTGFYSSSAVFSPSTQQAVTWVSEGDNDMFLARYAPDGRLVWVTSAGGSGLDEGHGVAALPDGSVYVAGAHSLYAQFGEQDPVQTLLPAAGPLDIFLARYNFDGTFRFATRAGGYSYDEANDVSALDDGAAYVTGYYTTRAGFGVSETNETVLTSAGDEDLFVARFNNDGSLDWVRSEGGTGTDVGTGIAAYPDGSVVAVGYLNGQFKDAATAKALARDACVVRYDFYGSRKWFRQIGGTGDTAALDVAALPDGGCLVVGGFSGTTTFGYGEPNQKMLLAGSTTDAFFARFAADGALVWVKSAPSALGEAVAYAVSACADDTFVAGGYFTRTATLGPGEARETKMDSAGAKDLFVARFSADGKVLSVCHGGGTKDEMVLGVAGMPIVDFPGDFLAVGSFAGPLTLGRDSQYPRSLSTSGGWDVLVARLSE